MVSLCFIYLMRVFSIISILFLFFSCKEKRELSVYPILEINDTIAFNFDNIPIPNERSSFGSSSESFYYTYGFTDSLGLYQYEFEKGLWEALFFHFDGPNGLKKDDDFVLINDTLAIHNLKGLSSFQLIDLRSKQLKTFKFEDSRMGLEKLTSNSIYFDGEVIGFPISYYMSNKDIEYTKTVPIFGIYHLDSSKIISHFGFPKDFHDDVYSLNFLSRSFSIVDQTIYLNMEKSAHIFSHDLDGKLIKKTLVDSEFVSISNPGIGENQISDMLSSVIEGRYSSFVFDGQNFSRTVIYFPNGTKPKTIDVESFMGALDQFRFKVIKLDKNLEKVGEGDFSGSPSKKGIGDDLYFTKNGTIYFWLLDKQSENIEKFVSVE